MIIEVVNINRAVGFFNSDFYIYFGEYKINILLFSYLSNRQPTRAHCHSLYEMHYILNGDGDFIFDFDDRKSVTSGDLILIGKDVYHEEVINSGVKMSGFCICFDIPNIDEKVNDFESKALRCLKNTRLILKNKQTEIQLQLEAIADEMQNKHIGYLEASKLLISLIILNLSRICMNEETGNFPVKPKTKKNRDKFLCDEFFNRVFDMDELTANELANKLSVSTRHLNRLLNEIYGMSFSNRINEMKLRFAKYQLVTSKLSVEAIAENCRWSSTYLIQQFKKRFNETPVSFRKNHEKIKEHN